jgi:hypothetical protein
MMSPIDERRRASIRREALTVLRLARILNLKRMADRTAAAFARSGGSEAELAALLVHEDALEAALRTANGRDASGRARNRD